jgi:hypothetical protein
MEYRSESIYRGNVELKIYPELGICHISINGYPIITVWDKHKPNWTPDDSIVLAEYIAECVKGKV